MQLLSRIPWFVGAPAVVLVGLILAGTTNYLGGDYFKRTFLDEENPLLGAAPNTPDGDPTQAPSGQPDAAGGAILARGEFQGADPGHNGSGTALLIRTPEGKHVLRFEDFSVTNGPDLFVVLSTTPGYSADALILDELRATDGNINYAIPDDVDVSRFQSAIIWCRQFRVTFATAQFEREDGQAQQPAATSTISPAESPAATNTNATPAATNTAPPPTNTPAPTATPVPSGPVVVSSGEFRDGAPGHFGSGTATLGKDANGNPALVLSDFSVTNGPDLHVILGTTEDGGGDGLDLGELKATDGTFSYPVPADVDLASFRSVTIFCKSFPTVFAVATLGGS